MIEHECMSCGSIFNLSFEFEEDKLSYCPSCGNEIEEELNDDFDDEWSA